ncbi:MAG TPA: YfhO family protein [Vicinamibacteria bacterium]|nr:YfhO family protein [Vicinamibacteria bacterium]
MRSRSLSSALRREVSLPRPDRRDVAAAAGLALLAAFPYRGALPGGQMLYMRDITVVWYPLAAAFVRSVAEGSWPLWDPWRGFGKPLLADPNAMAAYPFTWLNLILPLHAWFAWFVAAHAAFSAIGLYLLGRRFALSRTAAFAAGAVWVLSGPLLSIADLWHHYATATWLPWVVLAADRAYERPSPARAMAWGAALGLAILAGSADMVALTLAVLGLDLVLCRLEWRLSLGPANRAALAAGLGALAFALALSAVQWLPALDAVGGSSRTGLAEEERALWSLHPLSLLEVALPFRFRLLPPVFKETMRLLDLQAGLLYSCYLGLPALALLAAGLSARTPRRLFLGLLLLAALAVSFGRYLPAYPALVALVPPVSMLRYPVKAMIGAAFAWSLLVGAGLDAWRRLDPAGDRRFRLAVVLPLLAAAIAAAALGLAAWLQPERLAGAWFVRLGDELPPPGPVAEAGRRVLAAGVVGLVASALALWRGRSARLAGVSGVAVLVLALGDLAFTHRDLHLLAPTSLFRARPPVVDVIRQTPHPRVYVYDYYNRTRRDRMVAPRNRGTYVLGELPPGWHRSWAWLLGMRLHLFPPTNVLFGVRGSYDMDLLGLYKAPLHALVEYLRDTAEGTPVHLKLLQLGAVDYAIGLHPDTWWDDLVPLTSLAGPFDRPFQLMRVPDPLPLAYVVGAARPAADDAALALLADPSFDPRREVLLAGPGAARPSEPGFSGEARILELKPDRLRVETDASADGWLVVVEGYDAGWHATVDGRAEPVRRANVAFRAVRVPAGRHEIELVYRPASVKVGASLTVLALALGGIVVARRLRG